MTDSDPTLLTAGERPAVRLERLLDRPPAAVWRAITDREELRAWFPSDVVVAAWEPGETITFVFDMEEEPHTESLSDLTGTVLEVDPPRLLVFTWGEDTLRFELFPEPVGEDGVERTRLVLTNELPPGTAARNAAGWQLCLAALAGETVADDAWKDLFDRNVAAFEPVVGPQEGPPKG
ncbi:SRPBCC domain-containing protein [Streptomyces sp. 4N509B]|uniref:SRPBCC domain-containing protein n=1 Tax=Streptomyces sp. 4N509B TaxID=3457413 RepID=UPI003FD43FB2